ncbi:MAG: phosphate ABC transporter substrate-binding protein PstS [Candidatus Eremiobacter antarcticus]|nr:phosphate ABC transporter substrate-binding protein PstS [Candidatus Eremiobacteraeota bacterium]MBC5808281.1 phosphate ABC transporter substrate-binding protein PstS [Candidatus Eremiobacteraeota bacterium]PZR63658.1 MAG: phosphate ABC transporter substrate-binding protein PstS [Candidatus Eremiobacter sp. RRmetagenome_bin22]
MRPLRFPAAILIVCALLTACSNQAREERSGPAGAQRGLNGPNASSANLMLVGAGSTFDYPFFSRAFFEYNKLHPNVAVNYQSIGSGGGIRQFSSRTVDFGATDVPMSAKELAAIPKDRPVIQIPIALGGVVIAFNIPDGPTHLNLTPSLVADIFLGKITDWSDPKIARVNGGAAQKPLRITVVHRADGSGTTYVCTDYLSAVSPEWKNSVGKGKSVNWSAPSSVGAKGNEGVAGQIRNTPGAIGYIELAYALQNDIQYAAVGNAAGKFVLPSFGSIAAAAAAKKNVSPSDFSIVNAPGDQAYPIAGFSWVLLYQRYPDAQKASALRDLFHWLLSDGQQLAKSVNYVPLPPAVTAPALSTVAKLGKT